MAKSGKAARMYFVDLRQRLDFSAKIGIIGLRRGYLGKKEAQ